MYSIIIVIIGTTCFFGIRTIRKNIKSEKLEQITDKILEAVSIYIENNEEAKSQLYNSNNGVLVPLNVLQNEGLIDFQDIKIDDKDYVITILGNYKSDGACIDTTTIGSWEDGNKTIYLCTDKNGNSNLSIISQSDIGNLNYVQKKPYYFRGSNINNYAKLGDSIYKILYIDTDDNIVLYNEDVSEDMLTYVSDLLTTPYEEQSLTFNMAGTADNYREVQFYLSCIDGKAIFSNDYVTGGMYSTPTKTRY